LQRQPRSVTNCERRRAGTASWRRRWRCCAASAMPCSQRFSSPRPWAQAAQAAAAVVAGWCSLAGWKPPRPAPRWRARECPRSSVLTPTRQRRSTTHRSVSSRPARAGAAVPPRVAVAVRPARLPNRYGLARIPHVRPRNGRAWTMPAAAAALLDLARGGRQPFPYRLSSMTGGVQGERKLIANSILVGCIHSTGSNAAAFELRRHGPLRRTRQPRSLHSPAQTIVRADLPRRPAPP
jgi:hypothetical protein